MNTGSPDGSLLIAIYRRDSVGCRLIGPVLIGADLRLDVVLRRNYARPLATRSLWSVVMNLFLNQTVYAYLLPALVCAQYLHKSFGHSHAALVTISRNGLAQLR